MLASSSFIYEQTKFNLYDRSMIRERKFARVNRNIAKDEKTQIFNKKKGVWIPPDHTTSSLNASILTSRESTTIRPYTW